jgi:hypothetical protein
MLASSLAAEVKALKTVHISSNRDVLAFFLLAPFPIWGHQTANGWHLYIASAIVLYNTTKYMLENS